MLYNTCASPHTVYGGTIDWICALHTRQQGWTGRNIQASAWPFINYVLNTDTIHELEAAIEYALKLDASEFLILPEIDKRGAFNPVHLRYLKGFLLGYKGVLPLRINQNCADGMPVANPFHDLDSLNAYVFVDAKEFLRRTSYEAGGVDISQCNIINGLGIMRSHLSD